MPMKFRFNLGLLACLCGCIGGALAGECPANTLQALLAEARAYEHGEGVARDTARALALYCEGARRGSIDAQYSLGWMYANGRGIPRDDALAAYFFALAARQGDEAAQRMLPHVGTPVFQEPECLALPPANEASGDGDADAETLAASSPFQKRILDLVRRLAPEYGVHPHLALAVIRTESSFNPAALSPKNAQGLMQLIPATSARFKVVRPWDPEQNIRGGLAYLRWLLAYFRGDVALVAAAYNAGEGAVNRFRGIPPFAETRDYVRKVKGIFRKDRHPYDQSVTSPSPELSRIQALRPS